MRMMFLGLVVGALAVGVAVQAGRGSPAAGSPTLRAVALAPLTIRGERFQADERTTVNVSLDGNRLRQVVRASGSGTFTSRFSVAVDACNGGLAVTAVGGRGSRALLKLPQRLCPPAP